MKIDPDPFYKIPAWKSFPFLVHGFGDRSWKTQNFQQHPRLIQFRPLFLRQVHSDILHVIDSVPDEVLSGDAMLTDKEGLLLVIKTADCLPILIVDPQKKVVAAVHCGWKSTSQRLAEKVVECLKSHYHCNPNSLMVALGPCIGKDCYEVGEQVKQAFDAQGLREDVFLPHPLHTGKYLFDLRLSNKHQLVKQGVSKTNIGIVDLCSHCEENLYSYRRSPQTGKRMLSFIGLTPPMR